MVTLGTGIGGAAMLQGHLLHTGTGKPGCLG
jgi:predicted NBD/HSP70 family sugar kinase